MNKKHSHARYTLTALRIGSMLKKGVLLIPLLMIPIGFLIKLNFFSNQYYANDITFELIVESYLLLTLLYFLLKDYSKTVVQYGIYLAAFHALAGMFILEVSGFYNLFLIVWVLLMVGSGITYGESGLALSYGALVLTGILAALLHFPLPASQIIIIVQEILLVGIVGYLLAYTIDSADKDKAALDKTKEQETFQRERLLTLVNSMGDAVITTDEAGIIKVYNSAFLSLLDTNSSFVGKSIDDVLKLFDKTSNRVNIMDDATAVHKVFSRTDLTHKFNEDESIRLYINVAPIHPDYQSNGESGFIFIMRDITKEKTLEEERDEFIAIIGHELRTPVAIIEGNLSNIQLLEKHGAASEILDHAITDAHDQAMYLAKMINDLSTLSKAEHGINMQGTELIDPNELLTSLYQSHLTTAERSNLRLDLDMQAKLSPIRTNRTYLEEILRNLLGNAFKYTREGSVTLMGRNVSSGTWLAVKDTGIGISKSDQKHIFDKFYRSEDYRTRESSGTGLGLYISKKLADRLGLDLRFESRLNHGSTFSVTIKSATE